MQEAVNLCLHYIPSRFMCMIIGFFRRFSGSGTERPEGGRNTRSRSSRSGNTQAFRNQFRFPFGDCLFVASCRSVLHPGRGKKQRRVIVQISLSIFNFFCRYVYTQIVVYHGLYYFLLRAGLIANRFSSSGHLLLTNYFLPFLNP